MILQPTARCVLAAAIFGCLLGPVPLRAQSQSQSQSLSQTQTRGGINTEHDTSEDTGPRAADQAFLADEVVVTAKGTAADVPSALATDFIFWEDAVGSPGDFQDLIVCAPGIGATGQNGLFETFSIRGSGANGILVLVGGMPISAQRRAGVPVSFVEPSLLGQVNVTRGPATVHFGPGALGGAISIEPRWFDSIAASAGFADSGNESEVMGGFGTQSFSIGVARHRAGDSAAANGTPLNTSFERGSASLQYRARFGGYALDALVLPSRTLSIGKSNSRFPARDTTYPEDEHLVGRLRLRGDNGFVASVHGHDQSLLTLNQRPNTPDTFASIESLDIGSTLQQTFAIGDFKHNVGFEFFGRRNVGGFEARGTLNNRTLSLRDASEDAMSLFGVTDWRVSEALAVELGARLTTLSQEQQSAESDESDGAFSAGAVWTPGTGGRWSISLSSGYRFPTLEERFFTGVTPQGEIIGNPDLGSEKSLGIDIGHAWQGEQWDTQVHVWRTEVDDLIQLLAVAPEVTGYTNVSDARLQGIDASVGWAPVSRLSLRAIGTLVRSRDESTGDPLYGSPPLTASLEAKYDFSRFTVGAYYSHRFRMQRPGFEEVERNSVDVLDMGLTWHLSPAWDLKVYARNAFDEDYFATSDVLSALAQERSVGLSVTWMAQ